MRHHITNSRHNALSYLLRWQVLAAAAVLLLTVAMVAGTTTTATAEPGLERYIVHVEPGGQAAVQREVGRLGGQFIRALDFTPGVVVVAVPSAAVPALESVSGVSLVERDQVMTLVHHQCGHNHPRHGSGPCPPQITITAPDDGATFDSGASITFTAEVTGAPESSIKWSSDSSDWTDTGASVTTTLSDGVHTITASATNDEGTGSDSITITVGDSNGGDGNGNGNGESTQVTPWGIEKIEAPATWTTTTGAGVHVCVADTGIDKGHEDLSYVEGRNFVGGGPFGRNVRPADYQDGNGHGTHVSGTVAALDNELGVVGVAPDANLLIAKVLSDNGSGYISQIVDGLNWCAEQGAAVINMSFGSSSDSTTLSQAIEDIAADGVILVAASGNSGASQPGYPARYDDVIAVGATNDTDTVASWSNRGEDINAPGVSILSTVPGGYATYSGTSMASPHVAGVVALLLQGDATLTVTEVMSILENTADPITTGIRVNAKNAVAGAN